MRQGARYSQQHFEGSYCQEFILCAEALDGVIFQKVAQGFKKTISIHAMVQIFLIMNLNLIKAVPLNAS